MITPEKVWGVTFEKQVEPEPGEKWAINFTKWYAIGSQLLELKDVVGTTLFTLDQEVLITELKKLRPDANKAKSALELAKAWETAILKSEVKTIMGVGHGFTMIFAAGKALNAVAIRAQLASELATAGPELFARDSVVPKAFRNATLALEFMLVGIGAPPTFPFPPTAPFSGTSGVF